MSNVSGLGSTELDVLAEVEAATVPLGPAVYASTEVDITIDTYTDGPVRPGTLLFTWTAFSGGGTGGGGSGHGDIAGGLFTWGCGGEFGCHGANQTLPFTLGVPFEIVLSANAESGEYPLGGGYGESSLTLSLLDNGVPVTISPVPEPRFLGLGVVLMAVAFCIYSGRAGSRSVRQAGGGCSQSI
jgi:hypothetical protein